MHPDVIYFPSGMDGYKYWMMYTPYPPQSVENPSIVRSNDDITWTDAGITNPVISVTGPFNSLKIPILTLSTCLTITSGLWFGILWTRLLTVARLLWPILRTAKLGLSMMAPA